MVGREREDRKERKNYVADDVSSDEDAGSNFGFFRDFISFSVCSIDLKSLLLALGTE